MTDKTMYEQQPTTASRNLWSVNDGTWFFGFPLDWSFVDVGRYITDVEGIPVQKLERVNALIVPNDPHRIA